MAYVEAIQCDRCGKLMKQTEYHTIADILATGFSNVKIDLCDECYEALQLFFAGAAIVKNGDAA